MNKVKIGVFGCGRGKSMVNFCIKSGEAVVTAVCDFNEYYMSLCKKLLAEKNCHGVEFYSDFDEFLEKADMDAVVLANYACDHAPFAVKCLNKGKHVFSEVLPAENLKEAVELVEAVERSGKVYFYGENYCYFGCTREMTKLFREGVLGDFEYGEGEYIHNCQNIWAELTNGDPTHWRNNKSAFFYCTHSAGPLIHMTGLRPIKVNGFEGIYNDRVKNIGAGNGAFAVENVILENGGIFKSVHGGGLCGSSIWYSVYGSKGRAESAREHAGMVHEPLGKIYVNRYVKDDDKELTYKAYRPHMDRRATSCGHCGSDFYTMHNFIGRISGDKNADIIDVYEALDMFFVGHFGYLSALNGGISVDIPDFRDKEVRERYRNDTACTNSQKAGDMLLPSNIQGGRDCKPEVYDRQRVELEVKRRAEMAKPTKLSIWQKIKIIFIK